MFYLVWLREMQSLIDLGPYLTGPSPSTTIEKTFTIWNWLSYALHRWLRVSTHSILYMYIVSTSEQDLLIPVGTENVDNTEKTSLLRDLK